MIQPEQPKILGILGGMGPLASAEFVKTIYEYNLSGNREQNFPKILLYSDPSFPDRTEVLLQGDEKTLLDLLVKSLYHLCELKATKIIICCITAHYLLPKFPLALREKIICLVNLTLESVLEAPKKYLVICTKATNKLQLFQSHPLWQIAQNYILFPQEEEQIFIHQMIYDLKLNLNRQQDWEKLKHLQFIYQVDGLIVGCTEIHLLIKYWQRHSPESNSNIFLDPLIIIAQKLNKFGLT
ncbi:MAG: amino acid racemase [Oscillatoria sp. PMC 1051.18]|nr:amino acid racemase [Oscillatoria sp. PMC 1050.18]MEC5033205.1 amino acid racemase [Oscillatoria sp. PMC 1051.18]